MTHTIYHTEAIVLGGELRGEANKYVYLLTRDFGFISAHVQSVRELKSKLRYSLQDFSHSHVDLVQGRSGWRVTSTIEIQNLARFHGNDGKIYHMPIVRRVCDLLKRLLRGEEKNELLFEDVRKGFILFFSGGLSLEDAQAAEVVLVMRILNHLGYWGEDATLSPFLAGDIEDMRQISQIKKQKPRAIGAINKALQETQL